MKTNLKVLLVLALLVILAGVSAAPVQAQSALTIGPDTLPTAPYVTKYSQQFTASGGSEPYTFSLVSGSLPNGFSLGADGLLSGYGSFMANSVPGSYPITIQVQDANLVTASRDYTFVLEKGTPTLTAYASGSGIPDVPILWNRPITLWANLGIKAEDSVYSLLGTANFFVDGNPVPGCQAVNLNGFLVVCRDALMSLPLGEHTFQIDYVPTGFESFFSPASGGGTFIVEPGAYTIGGSLFEDEDRNGLQDYGEYGMKVAWTINLDRGCDGTVDESTTTTGNGYYEFSNQPGGHCYRIGEVIGEPGWQQTAHPGDFWLSEDVYWMDFGNYYPNIRLNSGQLPSGYVGQEYNQALVASGGDEPYLYTLADGELPAGLTLGADGMLSGIPTAPGSYEFMVKAEDANEVVGYGSFLIKIVSDGHFTFISSSNPSAPGAPVTFTLSATGDAVYPPIGLVTFSDDGAPIEGCSDLFLNYSFDDPDGIGDYPATCTTAALPDGTHLITASYTDMTGFYYSTEIRWEQVVEQSNTAPSANPGGPYLAAVNTSIPFDGGLSSDPENDALTYAWDFGDGSTGTGAAASHSYSAAGIFTACLTVNDGLAGSDPACTLAVVYDPSAGFVTGGGWINSPAGAYAADPTLTGQATFGFASKYRKGATVPEGSTGFQFQTGAFSFTSTAYQWLVVNKTGANAQFKGSGLVNGAADPNGSAYKFQVWAGDGSPDTFRIKIWWQDASGEHVVYDNGAAQPIGGGSIFVHASK